MAVAKPRGTGAPPQDKGQACVLMCHKQLRVLKNEERRPPK